MAQRPAAPAANCRQELGFSKIILQQDRTIRMFDEAKDIKQGTFLAVGCQTFKI